MRQPLKDRVNVGSWTEFEANLFNLITRSDEASEGMLFSARLELTQWLLDTVDRFHEERARREVVQ